jgi:hypothetical protein
MPASTDTFSTVKDVALLLLAGYGAVLSSFNWWNARQRDKRLIVVRLSTMVPTMPDGDLGSAYAKIEAVNTGQRSVTVSALTIELPTGHRLWPTSFDRFFGYPDTRLPATLSDGESAHLMMPYADLARSILKAGCRGSTLLVPICEDTAGVSRQRMGSRSRRFSQMSAQVLPTIV